MVGVRWEGMVDLPLLLSKMPPLSIWCAEILEDRLNPVFHTTLRIAGSMSVNAVIGLPLTTRVMPKESTVEAEIPDRTRLLKRGQTPRLFSINIAVPQGRFRSAEHFNGSGNAGIVM